MQTCRDVIKRAYLMLGAVDLESEPSGPEGALGLSVLQSLVDTLPGSTWWREVEASADYTAGENERVRAATQAAIVISVPVAVSSGETLLWRCGGITLSCCGGADRAPADGARVHVCDAYSDSASSFRYRADLGQWLQSDALTLASPIPLGRDLHEGLAALLAVRLQPVLGVALPPVAQAMAAAASATMRARFGRRQDVAAPIEVIATSSQTSLSLNPFPDTCP